jgi:hypothetical protein
MLNLFPKPAGPKTLQLRIRLIQICIALSCVNNVHAVDPRQGDATVVTTVPRSMISLQKTDYCNMTNSLMLIEKIIERRCLLAVWLERWHIGSNSVEVIKIAKLSDECFNKDIRGWFRSIIAYPEETQSVLTEEVNKNTEQIESMRRHQAWTCDDFIKHMDDGQRHRLYLRLFHYKAKLYSLFENEFNGATK